MHPLFSLSGRLALVTGGNSGIGLAIARGLAAAGAAVAIAGRNQEKNSAAVGELTSSGARAVGLQADVRDPRSCRAMVEEASAALGGLDILVNNAGVNIRKAPQDYSDGEWTEIVAANLTGVFATSQAAYPQMVRQGRGKIINIGSMLSIFGAPFAAPYAATKGGVVQLTKSLATSWAKDNIQVNAILPGMIDTALSRQARRDVPGWNERVLERTPAGRWGMPDDLAGVAVFLASPASDFVTGVAIPVDGGYSALA